MRVFCNDFIFNAGLRSIIDGLIHDFGGSQGFRCKQEFKKIKIYAYTYADMTMLPCFFDGLLEDNAVIFCPPRAARVLSGASAGKNVLILSMSLTIDEIKMALMKRLLWGAPDSAPHRAREGTYDGAIVKLALTGISCRDMANQALLNIKTVSYRKRMLMKKLGVQNKTELFLKLKIMGAERFFESALNEIENGNLINGLKGGILASSLFEVVGA